MIPKASLPFAPTPQLLVQYCTFHLGKVKCAADPEGRGRVQLEVPGLLGTGKKNWTDWVEVGGTQIGGTKAQGDEGIWWPLEPGQIVLVGFVSGDPFALWCIPGPPVQEKKGRNKEWTPKEAKKAGKDNPRDATRIRGFKTEAGHTILFDDRGKKEKLMVVDWTGAGLFSICAGKQEDEKEREGEESKPRKGPRRGMKTVAAQTSKKPGEILKDGYHLMRLCDLNGGGAISLAKDGAGLLAIFAANENGEVGPSMVFDAKGNNAYITAGDVQWQILGSEGKIGVTRQIIQEVQKVDVETPIKLLMDACKQAFEEFTEDDSGSGDAGGGGGLDV